ncbi:MAG: hypothetical protein FWC26_01205 [Fibromonadales bacterium]|nr:hypothetical protein [Fibromonadales bacterium]
MARITFTTMYDTTMRYLQRNGNNLNKLQEQIASESKINRPSDNPVGFTNGLNYGTILNALGQQKINMDDGEIYMTVMETTHNSINNVFTRCQELAVQASNDTETHQNRLYTNMEIRELLEHMVSLAQTQHKDNYIFSGKWTNMPPYEIKAGQAELRLNASNASIPLNPAGYNPTDPNSTYFDPASPVTINITDSNYWDQNAVPPDNPDAQRIIPGSIQLNGLMEKPNRYADLPEGHPDSISSSHPDYLNSDYEVDYVNGTITLISDKAKALFYDTTTGDAIETIKRDNAGNPVLDNTGSTIRIFDGNSVPAISFDYVYRNSIDMSGEILREIDTGITMKINANPDDLFGKNNEMDAFKEIISFMQGLWHNDQPQINRSIEHLNNGRERNLEQQAIEGARLNRLATVYDRNMDLTTANTDVKSRIEDVDLADALTQFALADAVYNASLQAAARLMQRSLMDYL